MIYDILFIHPVRMKSIYLVIAVIIIALMVTPIMSNAGTVNTGTSSHGSQMTVNNYVNKLENVTTPPSTFPTVKYYYGNDKSCAITTSDWTSIFTNVFDDRSIIAYNFSSNSTQYLIVFDITYQGLNPYGVEYVNALSHTGNLSKKHELEAFWKTANETSLVSGYTNWKALSAGAFPGFSWSRPKILPNYLTEEYVGAMVAVVVSVFVLYFVFNRRK